MSFQTAPDIANNNLLRLPQNEAYQETINFYLHDKKEREAGIILPVGCGKSGLITLLPFTVQSRKTLVIAPNVKIAEQLHDDFDPTKQNNFYKKCQVLGTGSHPEPVEIRGNTANRGDLDEADVVISNIQQLQGANNKWLNSLPEDYFDLIIFDEAHHSVANSWVILKNKFSNAKILNLSATPQRSDGQLMTGKIIYSFPIFRAIELGYVKRLKAISLNPRTLKYKREENGKEIEVTADEIRNLGETDSAFRRSIVTSNETLQTIVDASINELNRIRKLTDNKKHKIIASALNQKHCIQIKEAYQARGQRVEYIHTKEDGKANKKILLKLDNHELDVIVQVKMLGEGYDHPYLSVAAIFSIFSSLSPFVQFVGRIMRSIPNDSYNEGSVIFHVGANVASRWEDFRDFSEADQNYFDQLLPTEDLNFDNHDQLIIEPSQQGRKIDYLHITAQEGTFLEELPLLQRDAKAKEAVEYLKSVGLTPEIYRKEYEHTELPTSKIKQRQAKRSALDDQVKNKVGVFLKSKGLNPKGKELDKKRLGKENFVVLKSAIDLEIKNFIPGKRDDLTKAQLDRINENLDQLANKAIEKVFNGIKNG